MVFGMSLMFASAEKIVCTYIAKGIANLALSTRLRGAFNGIDTPTQIFNTYALHRSGPIRGRFPGRAAAIVRLDLSSMQFEVIRDSMSIAVDEGYISQPEAIEFLRKAGSQPTVCFTPRPIAITAPGGLSVHRCWSRVCGPTFRVLAGMSLSIQYFTSRGNSVLDANYGR